MMRDTYYLDPRVAAAYDAEHQSPAITVADIPFYVELAREAAAAGQQVLELACGTGRVTIPMADAGARVTGLDVSPAMLEVAAAKTSGRDNPRWVQGDMTDFDLGAERFGLVVIPFRSFLHLLTVAEQKACLQRIHHHLEEGGRLALNFFHPDLITMAEWMTVKRGLLQRLTRGEEGEPESWATREYSPARQTLDETRIEQTLGDANAVISRVYRNLRIRYVHRYEMEHLLTLSGFTVEGLYGWFDRRPFDDSSQEMVWVARKKKESPPS